LTRIEIQGLVKRYPHATDLFRFLRRPWRKEEILALDGLDLSLGPGRIYGLVGPNGAGKTTLLKVLAGLVLPTEGRILFDGEEWSAPSERIRETVGLVVADERSFFWRLTVEENLRFFATLQKLRGEGRRARIASCLAKVGLSEHRGRSFRSLSTGLRQRLAVARGLLVDPPSSSSTSRPAPSTPARRGRCASCCGITSPRTRAASSSTRATTSPRSKTSARTSS
jgi:ABC-2 type transport system ATP-binding protein